MNKKCLFYNLLIIVLVFIMVLLSIFLFKNIKFGLDLQGGFEVLYKVESLDDKPLTKEMVTNTYKILLKRIDILGVSEPDIIIEGNDRIRVKLAGITNKEEARDILSKTASLTFRDTNDNLLMTSSVLNSGLAKLSQDDYGRPAVMLSIADKDKFYEVTNKVKDYVDNKIVIWLDFEEGKDSYEKEKFNCGSLTHSKCLSAATVEQAFAGNVIIQGNFTKEEASNLAALINSGSIPTKLEEISSRTVNAAFGENTLSKTFTAGIIGITLIIIFIFLIYRYIGLIAGFGLLVYTFMVFLIFWLIGGVLTLPGIASLLLGIGMAIDACVISFERIKEELKQGKSLFSAFQNGYHLSFSSIIDANVTTLIVAIIMFIYGESSVKGFATVLIISIIVTIIIMVYAVKYLLKLIIRTKYFDQKLKLFINFKEDMINKSNKKDIDNKKSIDLFNKYKIFMPLSLIIIIMGIIATLTMNLNLSVDYKGGTYISLTSDHQLNINEIKNDLKTLDYNYIDIDRIDEKTIYIKLSDILSKEEINETNKYFNDKYNAESEIGVVSNIVKKELTLNAIYAIILSSIGMIIYISLRFRFSYAISALIALFHDALMILAVFAILNLEISIIFVAAILTIIGYSINDTVVIFDRLRENLKQLYHQKIPEKDKLKELINLSLNENLTRTLYTCFSTIIPIICLMIWGTYEIFNFNFAILIGLIAGTYSSLFLACQLWYLIEKRNVVLDLSKKEILVDELDELEVKGINK